MLENACETTKEDLEFEVSDEELALIAGGVGPVETVRGLITKLPLQS